MVKRRYFSGNRFNLGLILSSIAAVIIFLLTVTITSCKTLSEKPDEGAKIKEEQEDMGAEVGTDEKILAVEITIWDSCDPKERIALMDSIESFSKENPSIKIEARHLRSQEELEDQYEAASLAGSGPELLLISMDGVKRLAPENVVREIVDEVDYNKILDGLFEISRYNGKSYIIPFRSTNFLMFFYNKDLIDSPPSDFGAVIEYCNEVNNFEKKTYGWLLDAKEADWIIPFIGGYSDWVVDYSTDSLTLDTKSTEKTLEFLNYIYNEEKILPYDISYEEIDTLFKNGNVSMIINGSWAINEYKEAGLNFGVGKIPRVWQGSKNPTPLISGSGFMININCYGDKLGAVKRFIDYMLSEEIQIKWIADTQTFPVLENIDDNSAIKNDPFIYNAFQQAKICRGKPYEELIRAIRDAIRINTENVIKGNITPQEATFKIQEDAIKLRAGGVTAEEL